MKATSIEQIREHLARGGRVMDEWGDEIGGFTDDMVYLKNDSSVYFISELTPQLIAKWELLPIEEEKLPGTDAKTLPILTEYPTDTGQTVLWRDGAGSLRITSKEPLEFRQSNGQVRILIDGNDTGAGERIRKALLFGHYPSMNDLRDWWQATTGECIEWGERCQYCDGNGNIASEVWEGPCIMCKDHPGYTVRPTWMGEVKHV